MNSIGKCFTAVTAFAVMFGLSAYAHADGHEGMNVPTIKSSAVMTGLENPWDMAFLPDGTMFFTERCKGLSVRTKDGNVNALYGMKGTNGYNDSGDDLFCEGHSHFHLLFLRKDLYTFQ